MRLLVILAPLFLGLLAIYFIGRGLMGVSQAKFEYVRFRNGILTLRKQGLFSGEDVNFKPGGDWQDLQPAQLATHAGGIDWYQYPSGHPVSTRGDERQAIERCLLFAHNTKLLEAEMVTEPGE